MSSGQRLQAGSLTGELGPALNGRGPAARSVHGFDKIAAVLDVLAAAPGDLSLGEIADRSELTKATARRLLTTLHRHDYVDAGAKPGTYRLGLQLFRLGFAVQRRLDLRQQALPVMHDLAEATEETVSLCILRGDEALCIERVEGKHVQMLAMQVGTTLPLYIGAASRMLLASLPDERVEAVLRGPLRQLTRYSEVSPSRLREIVAQIRREGYAISDEDVTLGVAAIGAPIRGIDEEVLGTISISGIRQRLTRDRMPILVTQVLNAAARISGDMGHPGDPGRR